jgi:perosamine synthetase
MNEIPHSSSDITKPDIEAVTRILERNFVGYGNEVNFLERELCKLTQTDYVYAVNSGSSALHLAFKLLDLPKGSLVITSTYACVAIVNEICAAGLKPLFVDVGTNTVNADVENIIYASDSNNNVGAVLFPHIGGYTSDLSILKQLKIPIIEDCASSLGALTFNETLVNIGDILIFSFGSTKLITGGNGGAIAIRDQKKAKKIERLLDYEGTPSDYLANGFEVRYNKRLSDFSAVLARSQLSNLDKSIKKRRLNASRFTDAISKYPENKLPKESLNQCSFWRFVFFSTHKEDWISHFKKLGIDARPSIAHQLHRYFGFSDQDFPLSIRIDNELISLPIHTKLSEKDVSRVVSAIETFK